jgi:hypothetical protein
MANPDARWALQDVSKFVENLDAEIFVSLDYPPAKTDSTKARRRKIARSARNFKILTERFPSKTIMPVVHGRTVSEIEHSIQLIGKAVPNPTWIGLGGIVPLLQHRLISDEIARQSPEVFIAFSLAKIRKAFPSSKIHAFGAWGDSDFPGGIRVGWRFCRFDWMEAGGGIWLDIFAASEPESNKVELREAAT